jgi:putative colanic acid biosysnthesis UDP-glucose lipid carrier transferase
MNIPKMNLKAPYLPYSFHAKESPKKRQQYRSFIDEKRSYFIFKRIFDVIVSFLFISLVLVWLLPIIGFLIKNDSKGPVFFLQKRVGRGGRLFTCFKLRTMYVNQQADNLPAMESDSRITPLGRILRKTNLDEFPQFLNVLLGSMSIIGPRPHMVFDCNRFSSMVMDYKFRNFVKPGITGLAQIKGFQGPVSHFEPIFLRYQWDAFYVRNASFLLDLRIIRKTIVDFTKHRAIV